MVPPELTARLPMEFADWPAPAGTGSRLIVFGGVPGSGKSTLADAVGRRLGIPVFAIDWLLGALTPFGGRHFDRLLELGYEQLTTLAVRQLSLGQSAILDAPVEDVAVRQRWLSLARATGASFTAVLAAVPTASCIGPDWPVATGVFPAGTRVRTGPMSAAGSRLSRPGRTRCRSTRPNRWPTTLATVLARLGGAG